MRQLKITQSVTNRSEKSIDRYFSDITRLPLVTQEREVELAQKIREGDDSALQELVKGNLRFVVSVAKQYQNRGLSLADLINEGNLGLMKAARRFDETRGFKFISYAVWWIRQSLLQAIADQSKMIKIPLNKIGLENKFNKAYDKLEQKLGRRPSDEEIMTMLEISEKEMSDLMDAVNATKTKSYDSPMTNDESSASLLDVLMDKNAESVDSELISESLKQDISRALTGLTDTERMVLEKSFGLNGCRAMSLQEIALTEDYSGERVRQIREKAIRRLRYSSRSTLLKKYMQ